MRRVFRLPFTRSRIDANLREEFRFHIQERVEQFVAAGMSREDAEAEVARRFGNYEEHERMARQIDEQTVRERSLTETLETLRREIALAFRVLVRTPSFSLIALVTLALGIGASTAIFTVLDAVVLRPLAYDHSEELVSILHPASVPGSGERKWGLSSGGYVFFRANNTTLTELGMYRTTSFTILGGDRAEVARVARATPSLFTVLRARPYIGRLFEEADGVPDTTRRPVVLSYEFWQRRFGGDTAVIGKWIQTDLDPLLVVGVTRPGLRLPMPGPFESTANLDGLAIDLWIPARIEKAGPFYNNHPWVGVGRLKAGVTAERADREINALTQRLVEFAPNAYNASFMKSYNFRGEVRPLRESVLGPMIPKVLWAVFGSVVLVLLIAVANVANLFIVRMDARRREATVRTALGADRGHLATHYLAESLLLCVAAAVLGIVISAVGLKALLAIAPRNIPRLEMVSVTWSSAGFALLLSVIMALVFGLMPLLRRVDLTALREGGRGLSMSRMQRNFRSALVTAQMALALVLLASAGLMIRSFMHLRAVKPGLDPSNTLVFSVSLPFNEYRSRNTSLAFHRELVRRLSALPGVTAVGGTLGVPLDGGYGTGCSVVYREGMPYAPGAQPPCVSVQLALPGFFEALRMTVRGRTPTWSDVDGRTQAVVATKALTDRLWPGEDPIGKGIGSNGVNGDTRIADPTARWYRIVGVIPELRGEALDRPPSEAVFYAATSLRPENMNGDDGSLGDIWYLVRTTGVDPTSLTPSVQRIVTDMNPRIPFHETRTMDSIVQHSMQRTSFVMILLGISAAVALLLSAVGIYGVISYVVTQRRFEIGVRIALGARVGEVAELVMMQSVRLALAGVAFGIAGTVVVTRTLKSLLFDVSPTDPTVLGLVALVLLMIAALASFAPARRAARIDPVEALRAD